MPEEQSVSIHSSLYENGAQIVKHFIWDFHLRVDCHERVVNSFLASAAPKIHCCPQSETIHLQGRSFWPGSICLFFSLKSSLYVNGWEYLEISMTFLFNVFIYLIHFKSCLWKERWLFKIHVQWNSEDEISFYFNCLSGCLCRETDEHVEFFSVSNIQMKLMQITLQSCLCFKLMKDTHRKTCLWHSLQQQILITVPITFANTKIFFFFSVLVMTCYIFKHMICKRAAIFLWKKIWDALHCNK